MADFVEGRKESVWDYPRPPRLERSSRRVRVEFAGRVIADTRAALRVLETSHPPVWYLPPGDIDSAVLRPSDLQTFCEFKGAAHYWSLQYDERFSENAAWFYPEPVAAFAPLRDHVAFYPGRVDACFVDDERVVAQAGDFYGGWITSDIEGPLKGGPGTVAW
ncbi:MAG: DUF427 domain-containing protein [Pseudomonadota bacterium]|nr:MAG: DUF427 domain-containing protein [Pseudomonadota bacterium]